MARLARAVAVGVPHNLTQRGNRRQPTFFGGADYEAYRRLLAAACARHGVAVWAYCLMPNHAHLILLPAEAVALRRAVGEAHQRYTTLANRREGWVGHLWQGRFHSCALDGPHLLAALRYVELNPVRAGLRRRAHTGRPLSDTSFIAKLERDLGRRLRPGKPGPGRKADRLMG